MHHPMGRFFLIIFFFMSNSLNGFGQLNKFDELSNQMFFNIFVNKPDSVVFDFVKKYFPAFTEKFEPGGWTMYPPGPPPELFYTTHSLKFMKHPHFNAKFREGRLDIFASEEKEGHAGVTDFQLWFMFDTKKDADAAFNQLVKMFEKVSIQKTVEKNEGKRIAHLSDRKEMKATNSVELILTADELHKGKYKLFFRIGAYTYPEKNGAQ